MKTLLAILALLGLLVMASAITVLNRQTFTVKDELLYAGYGTDATLVPVKDTSDNLTSIAANLTAFRSTSDVRAWIRETGIPDRRYVVDTYDCDDFALDTLKAAMRDGVPVGLYVKMVIVDGKLTSFHMSNVAIKGGYLMQLEPETGNVWPLGMLD